MFSPISWWKSVTAGGQLAPFFKSVCVYFVALSVEGWGGWGSWGRWGSWGVWGAAVVKCAPVVCLAASVARRRGRYAARVALGLALSALGDALLVWPAGLRAGMAAFAGAHVAYVAAFGLGRDARGAALAAYGGAALYAWRAAGAAAAAGLRAALPPYALVLATMAWRAAAAAPRRGASLAAAAALFLLSDAVLGYTLFVGPLPYAQVVVMSTYYTAQLGIAYSALRDPSPRPAPAPRT